MTGYLIPILFLLACGNGQKQSEPAIGSKDAANSKRQIVVFSPHGQEILDDYEKAFEKAHPEIDVVGRFVPTGQILSQLRIDKDHPTVDVWWGGTSACFGQAKGEGLLQPYKPTWAAESKAEYHDADGAWYAQFLQVPAIMFNSQIYKPDQLPKTWDELLDPKWKDKIVIREPMDSGTMKTIFCGIIWQLGGASHDPVAGYEFLKKLDMQTKTYLPDPQALYDRVAKSQEGYISLWNVTDIIFQAEANHYPFGYRVPDDAVAVSLDPIALVNKAPHAEEAKLFYEFVTSKENCLQLARDHFRILARADIAPEELPARMTAIKFAPLQLDMALFDKLQTEWMEHWRTAIRNPEK